jgi:hypothetical protein
MPSNLELLMADLHAGEESTVAFKVNQALEFAGDHLRDASQGAGSASVDAAAHMPTPAKAPDNHTAGVASNCVGVLSTTASGR